MVADDMLADTLKFMTCLSVSLGLFYSRGYCGARGLFRGEMFVLTLFTVGFVAMEQGSSTPAPETRRRRLSGSNPTGVTPEEADELFDLQIGILTAGIARMHAAGD